jgi:hypothetical protein
MYFFVKYFIVKEIKNDMVIRITLFPRIKLHVTLSEF